MSTSTGSTEEAPKDMRPPPVKDTGRRGGKKYPSTTDFMKIFSETTTKGPGQSSILAR